jgi:two-component system, NarL family, response regulator LiaR
MSHTVFLVEDHTFTRDGLRVALQRDPELKVIGEARSGEEILEKYAAFPAEIVVMDIGLPGIDGIETTRQLKALYPNVKVVMLTVHQLEQEILAALASGANAYCLANCTPGLKPNHAQPRRDITAFTPRTRGAAPYCRWTGQQRNRRQARD